MDYLPSRYHPASNQCFGTDMIYYILCYLILKYTLPDIADVTNQCYLHRSLTTKNHCTLIFFYRHSNLNIKYPGHLSLLPPLYFDVHLLYVRSLYHCIYPNGNETFLTQTFQKVHLLLIVVYDMDSQLGLK